MSFIYNVYELYYTIIKINRYFCRFLIDIYQICCCCSVAKSYPTLCDPMDCSTPGSPVLHCLLEFAQICVHRVGVAV